MQGKGTQAEPFLVGNVLEFRQAAQQDNAYVKLTNDIDCNKENYLEWSALDTVAKEIDFNGYAIFKPLVKLNEYLIDGLINKTVLKNGKILNIYENSAKWIFKNCGFDNMAISAYIGHTVETPFYSVVGRGCNFVVKNHNTNKNPCFQLTSNAYIDDVSAFKNCRFLIDGNAYPQVFTTWNVNTGNLLADGCRFEGNLNITFTENQIEYVCAGTIKNSILAFKTSAENATSKSFISGKCDESNIYQSDISSQINYRQAIPCTQNEILNPDFNNSVGFNVVEVKV